MNTLQQQAHLRLMSILPVRTHWRMGDDYDKRKNMVRPTPISSAAGRKGREKAGLVIPEFRTLKQRKR